MSFISLLLVVVKQKMCIYPRKSPWILRVPTHSLAVEQLQKCCLVAELSLGSLIFCLGGDLLIFANYISLRVNSILVITECYVKQSIHTLPDKENILGWLFSGCQFADQKRILFICRRVDEGLVVFDSHSLPGYVEWLAVKVCLMYICLIRLPREEWISLVTLLHIFTHQ